MAKRRKKSRVKREPKPPTWVLFKCFNQTREEVFFGASEQRRNWRGGRSDLHGIPELAHWDIWEDKVIIIKIRKPRSVPTQAHAIAHVQSLERNYDHPRNFWVIQTGANTLRTPRIRKPIKPPRMRYGFNLFADDDIEEENSEETDTNEQNLMQKEVVNETEADNDDDDDDEFDIDEDLVNDEINAI